MLVAVVAVVTVVFDSVSLSNDEDDEVDDDDEEVDDEVAVEDVAVDAVSMVLRESRRPLLSLPRRRCCCVAAALRWMLDC